MKKKILVTGAEGFIGSHLTEHLLTLGYQVRAFVLYNSFGSYGWLESLPKETFDKLEIVFGDVRDYNSVYTAMKGMDAVFHLAALIAIPYSYQAPDSYVDVNIKGTLNVLQAAKKLKSERILITSTSEVYGTAKYVPMDELHPFQGQSPYSASKIGADRMAESFYRSFNLPVTIVRPFNTFGPRQSARAVIPTIITQLLNGEKLLQLGDVTPTRDFLFVKDAVRAFVEVFQSNQTIGEELNVATQSEVSIGDIAQMLIRMIQPEAQLAQDQERLRPRNSEVYRLFGSNKKICALTSWKPEYTLEKGLSETIAWFREDRNLAKYKSHIYNI